MGKSKVIAWYVVTDCGDILPAKYSKRSIYAGGDLWQFGTLGGFLLAEMSDGSIEYRHNFRFYFMDYADKYRKKINLIKSGGE